MYCWYGVQVCDPKQGDTWSPNLFLSFNGICTILISPIPGITTKCHSGKLKSAVLAVSLCFRKAFHWPFCRDLVGFSPLLSSGFLPWVSQSSPFSQSQRFFYVFVYARTCVHTCEYTPRYVCLSICVWDLTDVNS